MDRTELNILFIAAVGIVCLQFHILDRQQKQTNVLKAMAACIGDIQEYMEMEYQLSVDEVFEDIVSENFDEGL